MNISLNWLREFVPIDGSAEKIAETLTTLGLAVDAHYGYESIPGGLKGVVIGKIKECAKHPNADRLSLTKVDIGTGELLQIVCGAPNVASGQTVLVATIGSILHTSKGEKLEIKKGKIRGETSEGMICAGDELSINDDHQGILVLEDTWSAGMPASEVYPIYTDTIFEIDLTPNRSDATSHIGVAKDLAAYLNVNSSHPLHFSDKADANLTISSNDKAVPVTVPDGSLCPRYSGISISGVTIRESPEWLQNKLKAIGVRPISNVVDITNFILHQYGQPLHAFDLDKINGSDKPSIVVKRLPQGTKFVTLDHVERSLHAEDLMICNGDGQPLCIAGVFGGLHSGIGDSTQNIFLESAHFNASSIRRTSMRHTLRTDAATRFEKGTDPNNTVKALKVAANMILQLAGGKITSEIIDVYPDIINPRSLQVSIKKTNQVIGQEIDTDRILRILTELDMQPDQIDADTVSVKVPTNKADVLREIDVIEEILRIHGYNNVPIPSKLNVSFANSSESSKKQALRESTAQLLTDLGFNEMMGMSLMETRLLKSSNQNMEELVYINNTSNVNLDAMRPDVLRSGLLSVMYNQNRQQTDIKLYEFGKTYKTSNGQWPFSENDHLSILISGRVEKDQWLAHQQQNGFFYLKSIVQDLIAKWNLSNVTESDLSHADYNYGRQVNVNNKPLILYGSVNQKVLAALEIKSEVLYAEIDWQYLWSLMSKDKSTSIKVPGKFPTVRRDLAIVVDKHVSWDAISEAILTSKVAYLKSYDLFDVFSDESKLGKDKKSLAISFLFENDQQTLKENDLEIAMKVLQIKLKEKTGGVVR